MFTQRATACGALIGCFTGFAVLLGVFLYQGGLFTAVKPPQIISFVWFSLLGCLVTMIAGLVTSRPASSMRHVPSRG
jgi:sodium-coupled monocarboxylate transporter 8/12